MDTYLTFQIAEEMDKRVENVNIRFVLRNVWINKKCQADFNERDI